MKNHKSIKELADLYLSEGNSVEKTKELIKGIHKKATDEDIDAAIVEAQAGLMPPIKTNVTETPRTEDGEKQIPTSAQSGELQKGVPQNKQRPSTQVVPGPQDDSNFALDKDGIPVKPSDHVPVESTTDIDRKSGRV